MNHIYSAGNGHALTYALFVERDERKLSGPDRHGGALLLASDGEGAKATALAFSELPEAIIEDMGLREPQLDVMEVCAMLTYLTGDTYEIVLYETDADIVDRLFRR